MTRMPQFPRRTPVAAAVALLGALAGAAPAAAAADAPGAAFTCSASAVRVSLLGAAAIQPLQAGGSGGECPTTDASLLSPSLGLPLDLETLTARTLTAPGGGTGALASAGLGRLALGTGGAGAPLLELTSATSAAGASCVGGRPVLAGSSSVGDMRILGRTVGTASALTQTVPLLGGLAEIHVAPGEQTVAGNTLTERALRITITLGGRPLAEIVVGEARVAVAADACGAAPAPPAGTPAPTTASGLALACTSRRVVLTGARSSGRRVRVTGAADAALAGHRVSVLLEPSGRRVAAATVRPDGTWAASAPRPSDPAAARYRAAVGSRRSASLALAPRLAVDTLSARAGRVTIAGHVAGPLLAPPEPISVERRTSCRRSESVALVQPRPDGSFRVSVAAPAAAGAAGYLLSTRVAGARPGARPLRVASPLAVVTLR